MDRMTATVVFGQRTYLGWWCRIARAGYTVWRKGNRHVTITAPLWIRLRNQVYYNHGNLEQIWRKAVIILLWEDLKVRFLAALSPMKKTHVIGRMKIQRFHQWKKDRSKFCRFGFGLTVAGIMVFDLWWWSDRVGIALLGFGVKVVWK